MIACPYGRVSERPPHAAQHPAGSQVGVEMVGNREQAQDMALAPAGAGEQVRSGVPASDGHLTSAIRRRLSSDCLLRGDKEIEIEHDSAVYRLRLTSLGKLILTK